MADLLELQRQHRVFAEETFAFLLDNYKIESKSSKGYEFFRSYIGDAVLTISHIFRKDYRKVFSRLHQNLKHVKMFENYCKIVPVKKDERYFYYILTRISLIFELSMYCYDEGYDYFKTGWQCIAEYADLQFFESSGGWGRLGHTALFIASLGQPLTLMMTQMCIDQEEKLTFFEAFEALDKHFILTGNLSMLDGAEMYFLTQINKMFKDQTRKACKFEHERETEYAKNQNISLKAAASDAKVSDRDLITNYFKKCFFDLVSSKALGYSIKNLEENMPHLPNVGAVKDYENSTVRVESCDLRSATSDVELDFSDKKVVYIKQFETSYQPASIKCRKPFLFYKKKETPAIKVAGEVSALEMLPSNLDSHSSQTAANLLERNFETPNWKDSPSKCTDSIPVEVNQATECSEKDLPVMTTGNSEAFYLKIENYKLAENSTSQEDFRVPPTFIVPKKYLSFRSSDNSSKCMYLYSMKLYPPSARKTLDEPMRKLLNENIDNQNYNIMPSGDIIVCPRVPPQKEDTLIILAESSTDEVEEDIDILTCLFKKMEIDSQGSESGYSLRPRQLTFLEQARSSDDSDGSETNKTYRTESYNKTPLKFYQRVQRKPGWSIRNEKLPTEKLIRLYKKYFTSFLDVYFKREFLPQSTGVVSNKSSTISKNYYGYVFAVTASIMARRRVLLDDPDKTKPVLGIQLYDRTFQLEILPSEAQKALDSQIREHNYFFTSNGIYGVGPKRAATQEYIWVIFYSGNGRSNSLDFNHEDLKEIPKIFRSYEPVLEIFLPFPKDSIKDALEFFETFINELVARGLQKDLKLLDPMDKVISL